MREAAEAAVWWVVLTVAAQLRAGAASEAPHTVRRLHTGHVGDYVA